MTKQGRKGFWNHISGRSRVSHKVPVSSIGRATDEVKRDFKECEERFAKARKRQADLKILYRASMAYAKLYDPQLREELESTKKARKRGDRLHAESEVILAKVFSTSEDVDRVISVQSETNRLAKPATVLGITVVVVGIIAALSFLSG